MWKDSLAGHRAKFLTSSVSLHPQDHLLRQGQPHLLLPGPEGLGDLPDSLLLIEVGAGIQPQVLWCPGPHVLDHCTVCPSFIENVALLHPGTEGPWEGSLMFLPLTFLTGSPQYRSCVGSWGQIRKLKEFPVENTRGICSPPNCPPPPPHTAVCSPSPGLESRTHFLYPDLEHQSHGPRVYLPPTSRWPLFLPVDSARCFLQILLTVFAGT